MWDVFSFPDPHNKEKKWDLLLYQYQFYLDYAKSHIKNFQKVSKAYQYVLQNLTCPGVYLRNTFSNALFQKVLRLVPPTDTGTEVDTSTMTTFLSDSYDALEETLNHL